MNNQNQDNNQDKNSITPSTVITNAARFNTLFNNLQIGSNRVPVSIAKLLTVMGEQDNTIRILSDIVGQNHSDKQLHDMHNTLFGGSDSHNQNMDLENLFTLITNFINQQNQQIQDLVTKIKQAVPQTKNQALS
jgi:hypothetical protein